jgi:hypothetical protein
MVLVDEGTTQTTRGARGKRNADNLQRSFHLIDIHGFGWHDGYIVVWEDVLEQ